MLELGVAGSRKYFLGVAELFACFVGMIEATKPWIILLTGVADFFTYLQGRNYTTKMWISLVKQLIHDLAHQLCLPNKPKFSDSQKISTPVNSNTIPHHRIYLSQRKANLSGQGF